MFKKAGEVNEKKERKKIKIRSIIPILFVILLFLGVMFWPRIKASGYTFQKLSTAIINGDSLNGTNIYQQVYSGGGNVDDVKFYGVLSYNNTLNIQQLYNLTASMLANYSVNDYLLRANATYLTTYNSSYHSFNNTLNIQQLYNSTASMIANTFQIITNASMSLYNNTLLNNAPFNKSGTNVYLNNPTNNVGIGTTNPIQTLDVNGSVIIHNASYFARTSGGPFLNSSYGYPLVLSTSGSDAKLSGYNQLKIEVVLNDILFSSNDVELMRLKPSGNVGIGTITPRATLNVDGNFSMTMANGENSTLGTLFVNNMNVGIGTTTPTHKLNVVGNVNVTGNFTLQGYFYNGSDRFSFADLNRTTAGGGGAMDYTNLALTNISNYFIKEQNFSTAINVTQIRLGFGEWIDNLIDGILRIFGSLRVEGTGNFSGTIYINNATDISTLSGGAVSLIESRNLTSNATSETFIIPTGYKRIIIDVNAKIGSISSQPMYILLNNITTAGKYNYHSIATTTSVGAGAVSNAQINLANNENVKMYSNLSVKFEVQNNNNGQNKYFSMNDFSDSDGVADLWVQQYGEFISTTEITNIEIYFGSSDGRFLTSSHFNIWGVQ